MLSRRIPALLALLAFLQFSPAALGAGKSFDFKDPKGVNSVIVSMDSILEPVTGMASGVSGTVMFDPDNPQATAGKISIEVASLKFVHDRYTETAHGPRALDAQTYPRIEFTLKSIQDGKKIGDDIYTGTVVGDFTCHGVTKTISVPLKATYLKGKARERNRGAEGDLLVLRTVFTINRRDYGIGRELPAAMVAEEIEIRANIVGVSSEGTAATP